jgi:hypothetical protein
MPITKDFGQKYPIVQYDNETLTVMPTDHDQLLHLKDLLNTFSASRGLHVN